MQSNILDVSFDAYFGQNLVFSLYCTHHCKERLRDHDFRFQNENLAAVPVDFENRYLTLTLYIWEQLRTTGKGRIKFEKGESHTYVLKKIVRRRTHKKLVCVSHD